MSSPEENLIPLEQAPDLHITLTQLEILNLASQGYSLEESANERNVLPATINSYRLIVGKNFRANNLAHCVRIAIENGFLPVELIDISERPQQITPDEIKVLDLLSKGLSLEEIAQMLNIPNVSVKNHLRRLYSAMGVHTSPHAVRKGFELGLLELPTETDKLQIVVTNIGRTALDKVVADNLPGIIPENGRKYIAKYFLEIDAQALSDEEVLSFFARLPDLLVTDPTRFTKQYNAPANFRRLFLYLGGTPQPRIAELEGVASPQVSLAISRLGKKLSSRFTPAEIISGKANIKLSRVPVLPRAPKSGTSVLEGEINLNEEALDTTVRIPRKSPKLKSPLKLPVVSKQSKSVDGWPSQASKDFWQSPLCPNPGKTKRYNIGGAAKATLPESIQPDGEDERDGIKFVVKYLKGYRGAPAPLPEKRVKIGEFAINESGEVVPLGLTIDY